LVFAALVLQAVAELIHSHCNHDLALQLHSWRSRAIRLCCTRCLIPRLTGWYFVKRRTQQNTGGQSTLDMTADYHNAGVIFLRPSLEAPPALNGLPTYSGFGAASGMKRCTPSQVSLAPQNSHLLEHL